MPDIHATLSASASHRWLACPPSVSLESQFPDTTSEFAEEGTLAHSICELKLKLHKKEIDTHTFTLLLDDLKSNPRYKKEMDSYTDEYVDFIKTQSNTYSSQPSLFIEQRVDFGVYVPQGFGTADCILIGGDTMDVIDFKYGKGVEVNAEENPQMKLYALGAIEKFALIFNIKTVRMHIIQPRINNFSTWVAAAKYLMDWGDDIHPIAMQAFEGKGEYKSGTHCRFCKAKNVCRKRAEDNLELAKLDFAPADTLTNEEIGQILQKAQDLAAWAKDLQEYALQQCLQGESVEGWKVVEGRSTRQFKDIEHAFKLIEDSGIDGSLLYERRPLTLTAVEKLLGKKEFAELLADEIIKPQGKPTLVSQSDKRDEFTMVTIKNDFEKGDK